MAEYHAELNWLAAESETAVVLRKQELAGLEKKYAVLLDAVAEGYRTVGLKEHFGDMQRRMKEIPDAEGVEHQPAPRLPSKLADLYSRKVADLEIALRARWETRGI